MRVPKLSALEWIRGYPVSSWLCGDILAGVTASALVIPQAMAYASLAGLPVQAGLYFANGEHVTDAIRAAVDARDVPPRVVIVDGGAVHGIKYSAVAVLDLLQQDLKRDDIDLWGANFTFFSVEVIERAQRHGLLESFAHYQTVEAAIRASKETVFAGRSCGLG